jgi:hypothetical protein
MKEGMYLCNNLIVRPKMDFYWWLAESVKLAHILCIIILNNYQVIFQNHARLSNVMIESHINLTVLIRNLSRKCSLK